MSKTYRSLLLIVKSRTIRASRFMVSQRTKRTSRLVYPVRNEFCRIVGWPAIYLIAHEVNNFGRKAEKKRVPCESDFQKGFDTLVQEFLFLRF